MYLKSTTTMIAMSCVLGSACTRAPLGDGHGSEDTGDTEGGSQTGMTTVASETGMTTVASETDVDSGPDVLDVGMPGSTTYDPETKMCQVIDGVEWFPLNSEIEWPDACSRWKCTEDGPVHTWQAKSSIAGDVNVSTPEHIAELACITQIEGTLVIGGDAPAPASTVTSLVGLEKLMWVGQAVRIINNPALTSLRGLSGLNEVTGALEIRQNGKLQTLEGFSASLSALGDASIVDNDALTSLDGLEFLGGYCPTCAKPTVGENSGDARVPIPPPPEDSDSGVSGATGEPTPSGHIFGSLDISDNDVLVDTSAISKLTIVWTDVLVQNNAKLADLAGFASLYEVGGNLSIVENVALLGDLAREVASRTVISGTTTICGNMGDAPC